jgi:hypothetical protein
MGGGLLQLTFQGQMNISLFYNPQISFFNYAYKKHTNFAIENIICDFDKSSGSIISMHNNTIIASLLRNSDVDLLSNLYFVFKLPNIYSDDKFKFKWVENIGSLLIKEAKIKIDDIDIDTITGEWIIVWNELSMPVKDGFNNMTGNIAELINPRKKETTIRIKNNIISEYDYQSSDNLNPSIKERYISVPLPFWFSKNPSLAIPILKFCSSRKMDVCITLENIENLYTVYSDIYNMHISPNYYNELYNKKISISDFAKKDLNFFAHIEATYIVLDCYERQMILNTSITEYLIETVSQKKDTLSSGGENSIRTIDVSSQILVKEIIWTLNRKDSVEKFNNICNYTYSVPNNNEKSIMKKAHFLWGKGTVKRIDDRDAYYYNNIQPYQHHSIIPRQGIYCYSFSLYPEKWFPSGCYNGSGIEAQLVLTFNNYESSLIDDIYMKKFNRVYKDQNINDIIITIYKVEYNILIIKSGVIKFKYTK